MVIACKGAFSLFFVCLLVPTLARFLGQSCGKCLKWHSSQNLCGGLNFFPPSNNLLTNVQSHYTHDIPLGFCLVGFSGSPLGF